MYTAKPTKELLAWQELELGVIIHYCMDIYNPDFKGYKTSAVRDGIPPERINPKNLDVEQWVRAAKSIGAEYAVLVTNHCTGFSLWPTKVNDYCTRSLAWKDGKGDICRDFIDACKKYDIRPGFYYSTGCNGYYNINDETIKDYTSRHYKDYVKQVEAQVTELWTQYGELFEAGTLIFVIVFSPADSSSVCITA
ncbi:MAG: alpha-L-fucosidase, partial [Clostridia bacterium]|nr:alpha-L-fucosidase [Clostridia bacterium]